MMYLDHFGLREAPFSITPNTAFAFATRAHREALNTLLLALDGGEGFIKITGEVGTGKTLACRRLLALLAQQDRYMTAYVPNPCLSPRTLLLSIAMELRLPIRADAAEHELLSALNSGLMRFAAEGRRVVLCLDEAQAIPTGTLEALRLLSNLETETAKLLQVVLFGQPELDRKLAGTDLRQLAQRIAFSYELGALDAEETERYVAHRLRVAGFNGHATGGALFAPAVMKALHQATGGVPRLINIVAHKALLLAFGEGALRVEKLHVAAARRDTPQAQRLSHLLAGLRLVWTRPAHWWRVRRLGASA
ncbi:MAG: AAA family ATPase [Burkholderiaceae bacterium]|nr:AAA family ATPase [Burkholderiaceae bacterium]